MDVFEEIADALIEVRGESPKFCTPNDAYGTILDALDGLWSSIRSKEIKVHTRSHAINLCVQTIRFIDDCCE